MVQHSRARCDIVVAPLLLLLLDIVSPPLCSAARLDEDGTDASETGPCEKVTYVTEDDPGDPIPTQDNLVADSVGTIAELPKSEAAAKAAAPAKPGAKAQAKAAARATPWRRKGKSRPPWARKKAQAKDAARAPPWRRKAKDDAPPWERKKALRLSAEKLISAEAETTAKMAVEIARRQEETSKSRLDTARTAAAIESGVACASALNSEIAAGTMKQETRRSSEYAKFLQGSLENVKKKWSEKDEKYQEAALALAKAKGDEIALQEKWTKHLASFHKEAVDAHKADADAQALCKKDKAKVAAAKQALEAATNAVKNTQAFAKASATKKEHLLQREHDLEKELKEEDGERNSTERFEEEDWANHSVAVNCAAAVRSREASASKVAEKASEAQQITAADEAVTATTPETKRHAARARAKAIMLKSKAAFAAVEAAKAEAEYDKALRTRAEWAAMGATLALARAEQKLREKTADAKEFANGTAGSKASMVAAASAHRQVELLTKWHTAKREEQKKRKAEEDAAIKQDEKAEKAWKDLEAKAEKDSQEEVALVSCDEHMYDAKGHGYRGCQTVTRSGKTCQRWDKISWQQREEISSVDASTSGLTANYCRNPAGGTHMTIWCFAGATAEPCDPLGPEVPTPSPTPAPNSPVYKYVLVAKSFPQNEFISKSCPASTVYRRHVCGAWAKNWTGSGMVGQGPYSLDNLLGYNQYCTETCDCTQIKVECERTPEAELNSSAY